MPRPTVVVGLGGTGQWVLTWLKRDLMLANNGEMPGNVQLLEIDTATKLEAGATGCLHHARIRGCLARCDDKRASSAIRSDRTFICQAKVVYAHVACTTDCVVGIVHEHVGCVR